MTVPGIGIIVKVDMQVCLPAYCSRAESISVDADILPQDKTAQIKHVTKVASFPASSAMLGSDEGFAGTRMGPQTRPSF